MTKEEAEQVVEQLRTAGVNTGEWFDMRGGEVRIKSLEGQKQMLESLRDLMQSQLDENLKQVQELHEQLIRARHGGGH